MAIHPTSIQSLSDDLLRSVLILLPLQDRMRSSPLVCQRWRTILADASMWPVVNVTPQIARVRTSEHARIMDRWLRQRSPGMRELTLLFRDFDTEEVQSTLLSVAPAATQLQQLQIVAQDGSVSGYHFSHHFGIHALACITQLRTLTRLEVSCISTPLEKSSLDVLFASLPALEFVRLHFRTADTGDRFDSDADDEGNEVDRVFQTGDFPLSLLRCTRLTFLQLSMFAPMGYATMFSVGGLPSGITALQRLQHLGLGDCLTAPLTPGISLLTQLTSLEISHDQFVDIFPTEVPVIEGALPNSLRTLKAFVVYDEVLEQLTALQNLDLNDTSTSRTETTCNLSALQQLTIRRLGCSIAGHEKPSAFGCGNLRTLRLRNLVVAQVEPLPFPQLTRLCFDGGEHTLSDILIMASELPCLEVLEMLHIIKPAIDLRPLDAAALRRFPKLRTVDLSWSELWASPKVAHGTYAAGWHLHVELVEHLMLLQQAAPQIRWIFRSVPSRLRGDTLFDVYM